MTRLLSVLLTMLVLGPVQMPYRGVEKGDIGILLPREERVGPKDRTYCGDYIKNHPSLHGSIHLVTIQVQTQGEYKLTQTIPMDREMVHPNLDISITGNPRAKIAGISETSGSNRVEIWMNQQQLDDAACLKKTRKTK